jgi:hypothetical protein
MRNSPGNAVRITHWKKLVKPLRVMPFSRMLPSLSATVNPAHPGQVHVRGGVPAADRLT